MSRLKKRVEDHRELWAPEGTVKEYTAYLQDQERLLLEKHADLKDKKIFLEEDGDWDHGEWVESIRLIMVGTRQETDEEVKTREKVTASNRAETLEKQKKTAEDAQALYLKLKAKYDKEE